VDSFAKQWLRIREVAWRVGAPTAELISG